MYSTFNSINAIKQPVGSPYSCLCRHQSCHYVIVHRISDVKIIFSLQFKADALSLSLPYYSIQFHSTATNCFVNDHNCIYITCFIESMPVLYLTLRLSAKCTDININFVSGNITLQTGLTGVIILQ